MLRTTSRKSLREGALTASPVTFIFRRYKKAALLILGRSLWGSLLSKRLIGRQG
jgi:hypothetical protein